MCLDISVDGSKVNELSQYLLNYISLKMLMCLHAKSLTVEYICEMLHISSFEKNAMCNILWNL